MYHIVDDPLEGICIIESEEEEEDRVVLLLMMVWHNIKESRVRESF